MASPRFRPNLLVLVTAWLGAIAFATQMMLSAEIGRWQSVFNEDTRLMVSEVKRKLDTNEAVLAGFSAFLQAVDRNDTVSTMKYAAVAAAAYPHIYMIELARKVDVSQEKAFEASMRKAWRADFSFKDFSEITGRPLPYDGRKSATWPVLFMYPSLPEADPIYGVRLETVDYLSRTMAFAQKNIRPVVSPVFQMYEGDRAFILLQEVIRPAGSASELNIFGDTMMAMVLTKAQDLIPAISRGGDHERISFSASILSPGNPETLLFERNAPEVGKFERIALPRFTRQLKVDNASQPMLMTFERQLIWRDFLLTEKIVILALLGFAMFVVPWVTVRHYMSLDRADIEQERSAYLATHDLLTSLPNRFLFADRFEHALHNWQRNGSAFALLLADLDHFKVINDRYGHDVGDQVLVACAQRMAGELRACDTVARQGGDEFIILLANTLNTEDAKIIGKKLLAAISEPIETTAGPLSVTCSIGFAICPTHGVSLDVLRKLADVALYRSKDAGRNTVSVFTGEIPVIPSDSMAGTPI